MASYLKVAEMGLENFSRYGKLIGTGKNNGVKVYEKLINEKRILTSLDKDGKLFKEVCTQRPGFYGDMPKSFTEMIEKTGNDQVCTTTVKNFKTGEEVMHVYTSDHAYDSVVRSNPKEWESFTACAPNKKSGVTAYNDIDGTINFSSYDLANQKGIAVEKRPFGCGVNLYCDSFQIRNGKKSAYGLTENIGIPNHIYGYTTPREPSKIGEVSMNIEKNLGKQVLGYFDKMFAKFSGYKPKA